MADNNKVLARGWDAASEVVAQSGNWIKLEAGQSVVLNIVSEPEVFEKTFDAPGEVPRTSIRYSFHVFVPGSGLKIWEVGTNLFKDIKRQWTRKANEFGNALFLIERFGSGMKTKYAIDYDRQLSPSEVAERDKLTPELPNHAAQSDIPF